MYYLTVAVSQGGVVGFSAQLVVQDFNPGVRQAVFIWRFDWERISFQAHSEYWKNLLSYGSVPSSSISAASVLQLQFNACGSLYNFSYSKVVCFFRAIGTLASVYATWLNHEKTSHHPCHILLTRRSKPPVSPTLSREDYTGCNTMRWRSWGSLIILPNIKWGWD